VQGGCNLWLPAEYMLSTHLGLCVKKTASVADLLHPF
jgi:hypothetical protein